MRNPSEQNDLFLMCLCIVWNERNNILWKQGSFNPSFMASWVVKHLEEFQRHLPKAVSSSKRSQSRWRFPPSGRLKLNVDGAYDAENQNGGIGVICRDDEGRCVAAFARPIQHAFSAL